MALSTMQINAILGCANSDNSEGTSRSLSTVFWGCVHLRAENDASCSVKAHSVLLPFLCMKSWSLLEVCPLKKPECSSLPSWGCALTLVRGVNWELQRKCIYFLWMQQQEKLQFSYCLFRGSVNLSLCPYSLSLFFAVHSITPNFFSLLLSVLDVPEIENI